MLRLVLTLCGLVSGNALADSYSAGTYTYWNRGSARTLALGGAGVAERSHSGAYLLNQAAMINQPYALDGSVVYGEPLDKSVLLENANQMTHRYLMIGGSVLFWNRIAFGLGLEQIRFIAESTTENIREFSDSVLEMNASMALKITQNLSLSAAYIRTVSRRDTSLQQDAENMERPSIYENGNSVKFGLMWQPSPYLRLGATHRLASTIQAEQKTGTLFARSYIPQKTEVGMAVSFVPESVKKPKTGAFKMVKLFLQTDIITYPELHDSLYYAPAVAYGEQEKYRLNTNDTFLPRVGLEVGFLRYKHFDLTGLVGAYREPAFTVSSDARNHTTFGAHMRLWFLSTNLAFDYSHNYVHKNIEVTLARSAL